MIRIPKRNATPVIEWLDQNVSANRPGRIPDSERTAESRTNPWSVSVTSQTAYWRGENDLWKVTQWGRRAWIEVECLDPKIETLIALRWSQ